MNVEPRSEILATADAMTLDARRADPGGEHARRGIQTFVRLPVYV
jgi:hypothetical protein